MQKIVEIDVASIGDDKAMDLDFELSQHLIEMNIRHSVAFFGDKLVFILDGLDIIIYNIFIGYLKKKNLSFTEI